MPDNNYEVTNNEKGQQFEVKVDGQIGYLSYKFYKNSIAFMHTVVPKELEGKGIASTLAKAAFKYAEEHHHPVMVYCPFVAEFLKKHPEYNKQLDPEYHKH